MGTTYSGYSSGSSSSGGTNYDSLLESNKSYYDYLSKDNALRSQYGVKSNGSSSDSDDDDDNSTMEDAKTLSEMELGNEQTLMSDAHGYRTKEAEQDHGYGLENKQKDYDYTSALNKESHGYDLESKAKDYEYTDALNKSQYGYQLSLQQDNNASKLKMQDDAQEHDSSMFNARDAADTRRTTAAYDRARSAFRGSY